jgi:hypothetical protein
MLIVDKDLWVFMNWFQSTNAKEIGTLYLIFAVFAGMIGTAFSVLIRLELSSPGVQFLQGDHQLFIIIFLLLCACCLYILPIQRWSLVKYYSHLNNILTPLFKKGQKMNMETINLFKHLTMPQIIWYVDFSLFILFVYFSIIDIVGICSSLVDNLAIIPYGSEDCLLQMNNNRGLPDNYGFIGNSGSPNNTGGNPGGLPSGTPGGPNSTHHTTVQIIHDDGSFSNGIRNLFVYGTGAARM